MFKEESRLNFLLEALMTVKEEMTVESLKEISEDVFSIKEKIKGEEMKRYWIISLEEINKEEKDLEFLYNICLNLGKNENIVAYIDEYSPYGYEEMTKALVNEYTLEQFKEEYKQKDSILRLYIALI